VGGLRVTTVIKKQTPLTLPAVLRYDFKPATTTVGEQWVRNAGNLKAILRENQNNSSLCRLQSLSLYLLSQTVARSTSSVSNVLYQTHNASSDNYFTYSVTVVITRILEHTRSQAAHEITVNVMIHVEEDKITGQKCTYPVKGAGNFVT
jgi:hypothetical protein